MQATYFLVWKHQRATRPTDSLEAATTAGSISRDCPASIIRVMRWCIGRSRFRAANGDGSANGFTRSSGNSSCTPLPICMESLEL